MRSAQDITVDSLRANQSDIIPIITLAEHPPILGSIALNINDNSPYYADGTQWLPFGGGGILTTLTSAGGTETLVNDGIGPSLATKGLTAGPGISLSSTSTDVTVTNTSPGSSVTLTSAGGTETLVNDGTGPTLATKGLTAGPGISLSSTATDITITNTGGGGGGLLGYSFLRGVGPDLTRVQSVPSGNRILMSPLPSQFGFTNPAFGQIQCPANGFLSLNACLRGMDVGVPSGTKKIGLFRIGDAISIVSSGGVPLYGNSNLPTYMLNITVPVQLNDIFEIRAYSSDGSNIDIDCLFVNPDEQYTSWATFTLFA